MTWTMIPFVILCAAPWVILLMWWRDVRWWRRPRLEALTST
jgi:hypothetical protein